MSVLLAIRFAPTRMAQLKRVAQLGFQSPRGAAGKFRGEPPLSLGACRRDAAADSPAVTQGSDSTRWTARFHSGWSHRIVSVSTE